MNCPRCNQPMENFGNVKGIVYATYPPVWREIHACRSCKVKVVETVRQHEPPSHKAFLDGCEEIQGEQV